MCIRDSSGSAVERSVGVVEVFSRAGTGAADASSAFSCNSTNKAVLGTYVSGSGTPAGCTLVLNGSEVGGGSVSVLLPALSLTLPMRVWYPISATVSIADGLLNRISGADGLSSIYQVSKVVSE